VEDYPEVREEYPKLVDFIEDDHWPSIEINQLRDDIEEATMGEAVALHELNQTEDALDAEKYTHQLLKDNFQSKLTKTNAGLQNKCMTLLDLIDRYEVVLDYHRKQSGLTAPFDAKIKQLRKRGGLDV
jgi:D-mannonate dehydratase